MEKINEFWYCVSPQENLPIYEGKQITINKSQNLIAFINKFNQLTREESYDGKEILKTMILEDPDIIKDLRVLLGISDKRLYLDLTYLSHIYETSDGHRIVPEDRYNLTKHNTTYFINQIKNSSFKIDFATLVTNYFLEKDLKHILEKFSTFNEDTINIIFDNLIAPKELQQAHAKYRGHGAEMEFSKVFKLFEGKIFPENKHLDPMGSRDPNVNLSSMKIVDKDASNPDVHSFDLVVFDDSGKIKLLIQSLIHSSDPGQYGVDKSNETVNIRKSIDEYNQKNHENQVYLIGSVDGVGFCENPNGTIVKMLNLFDDFFQMNTLFKIPMIMQRYGLIDNIYGIELNKEFFNRDMIHYFKEEYLQPFDLMLIENDNDNNDNLVIGKGKIYLL